MNGNEAAVDAKVVEEDATEKTVYMWGYLPGASSEKAPILSPTAVHLSDPSFAGDSWRDICGGGCGFAVAISEKGKVVTWGSADDENQSYMMSGKHGEIPGVYKLPTEASVVKAAAGWAHCATVTEHGDVYLWGWKECVPSGKVFTDLITVGSPQKDLAAKNSSSVAEQESPPSPNTSSGSDSHPDNKKVGEEAGKRRKVSFSKQESDSQASGDDFFIVSPSLVTLGQGVKITSVAVGGRHTLALSDVGQVWGWGYGGEGQLGLGSRVKMVSSPHLIPCIESHSVKDKPSFHQANSAGVQGPGSYVVEIACGGRHSVVITDAGALLTFGWGLHGQCGQGNNADQLRPTLVPSLLGSRVKQISAGLWHTLCVTVNGQIYAFGGNQFGQLGTGNDQPEDQNSWKTIGTPREMNGLYYLDGIQFGNTSFFSSNSTSSSPDSNQVMLLHKRLGHPSFSYHRHLFPAFSKEINSSQFHCEACHLAKDHRVSFKSKVYSASEPFYLIHSDVWGLSKIKAMSGKKWC